MIRRTKATRRRREVLRADLDRAVFTPLWGESDPARDGLRDAVRAAVASALTDKQREAVELFYFEGRSQGEIARALGISQQVVQRRLFGATRGGRVLGGALARLREALAPCLGNGLDAPLTREALAAAGS